MGRYTVDARLTNNKGLLNARLTLGSPGGKNFLCDQNLELPLFLRPVHVNFFPNLEKF